MREAHVSTQATESGETPPTVPAALPLYGGLQPLEGGGSAWPVYEEQVHVFLRASDTRQAKQRVIFLTSGGTRIFSLLLDLLKPATPHAKTLSELLATLRSRLDSLLWDRFVCGINNPAMQTRLLELAAPSLDDVVTPVRLHARSAHRRRKQRSTRWRLRAVRAVASVETTPPHSASSPKHNASPDEKLGTLHGFAEGGGRTADSSSSLDLAQVPHKPAVRVAVARVRACAAAGSGPSAASLLVVLENPPIFDMWQTGLVPSSVPPYVLTVEVCGHPISMDLAIVSVVARKRFKRTFLGLSVEATGFMQGCYSGELTQVQGQAQAFAGVWSTDIRQELPSWFTLVRRTGAISCQRLISARPHAGWKHVGPARRPCSASSRDPACNLGRHLRSSARRGANGSTGRCQRNTRGGKHHQLGRARWATIKFVAILKALRTLRTE
ncbi:hypothetical protein HPB49_011311 [Dermacentor silvarum]|uniref:Uncharacterized protein n=1 Tax=Dermacentor silvarum TaxID=543639 RepID=A0ACB8CKS8_DERSI|nr:hypothetical protein HPB49_011311 [Dermacentor silvarum]